MGNVLVLCSCGRKKDKRSTKCATCSGKSYPADGQDPRVSKEEIVEAIANSPHYKAAAASLGISRQSLIRMCATFDVKTSHFVPGRGRQIPPEILFSIHDGDRRNNVLVARILQSDLIPYRCETCDLGPEWQGRPLRLELDHKNGVSNDNRLDNLRFLCPNCHTQTPTHRGANSKGVPKPRKK